MYDKIVENLIGRRIERVESCTVGLILHLDDGTQVHTGTVMTTDNACLNFFHQDEGGCVHINTPKR